MKKLLLLVLIGFLAACEQAVVEEVPTTYQITYELTHLNIQRRFSYDEGERLFLVSTKQDGYEFKGWFLDAALTIPFTDTLMPARNFTLYPGFQKILPPPDIDITFTPVTTRDELALPEICRVRDATQEIVFDDVAVGFPLPPSRTSTTGELRVKVIFIDFPDFEGTRSAEELAGFFEDYVEGVDDYFTTQSFNQLRFVWDVHPGFIRMEDNFYDYTFARQVYGKENDLDYIVQRAVFISDPYVDYSDVDIVVVFLNPDVPEHLADVSPAWPLNPTNAIATEEGPVLNLTFIAGDGVRIGWYTLAHEIGHLLGLMDLYNYLWQQENPSDPLTQANIFMGLFDMMSFGTDSPWGNNTELLGWNKYLLNWINEDQVRCLDASIPSTTVHLLEPNHIDSSNEKIIATKITDTMILISEVKDKNPYCTRCRGGVYSYIVDTTILNGLGPIRMLLPEHSEKELYEDAYLSQGQTLTYQNITIEHLGTFEGKVVVNVTIN